MVYRAFQDLKLSALGMGGMRLPVLENKQVDQSAVNEMVDCAMAGGINYYDTAWGYHNGQSETALGAALRRHPRERYYIADKFRAVSARKSQQQRWKTGLASSQNQVW